MLYEIVLGVEDIFRRKGLENKSIAGRIGARIRQDLSNLTKAEKLDNKSEAEKEEFEKINTRKILANLPRSPTAQWRKL